MSIDPLTSLSPRIPPTDVDLWKYRFYSCWRQISSSCD